MKIAGISVKIKTRFPETRKRFRNYESSEKLCPEMVIEATSEELLKEGKEDSVDCQVKLTHFFVES